MLITILKRLGLGVRVGASIGMIVALFVPMARWFNSSMNYVRGYYIKRIHRVYHAIQMEVLHINHEMQFKVLSTHHGIQVEVLYAHRRWLILNETLLIVFLGLLLVALGLLRVAAAIRRHTRATERTDAWEHKRHRDIMLAYERELRQERVDRSLRSRAAFRAGAGAGSRHATHGTRTRLIPPPCPENQTFTSSPRDLNALPNGQRNSPAGRIEGAVPSAA
jgi:hypothetical protein